MEKPLSFWSQILMFEKNKMDLRVAFRAALGMAFSLWVGVWLQSSVIGMSIALGSLNACFSDKSDAYSQRIQRMLASATLTGVGIFIAGVAAHSLPLLLIILMVAAFIVGMLVVIGQNAADLGVIAMTILLIFSAQPLDPDVALKLGLYGFAGGILQSLLGIMFWPFHPDQPERRALSAFYQSLATLSISPDYNKDLIPPGSSQSTETQSALQNLAGDERTEARRYRSLLSQGERLRITILSLLRLRKRMQRDYPKCIETEEVTKLLKITSEFLNAVSEVMVTAKSKNVAPHYLQEVDRLILKIKNCRKPNEESFLKAVLDDLTYQIEALSGQLRAITELALKTTTLGNEKAGQAEAARPLKLRFWGPLATLRANLTLQSPGFRHAIRLSVCVLIGELIGHITNSSVHRAYWIPMTIAIVLKPDYASTFSRGFLRMVGTLVGVLLATLLFYIFPPSIFVDITFVVLFTFFMRWIGAANYGIFATCVAAVVVFLLSFSGVSPSETVWARGINTCLGGLIALAIYWCWPTSEKLQMNEVIARMLETHSEYFSNVIRGIQKKNYVASADFDRIRQRVRLARSNFQEASARYMIEKGSVAENKKMLSAVQVAMNRFGHAIMTVEAGSAQEITEAQAKALNTFAESVEKTFSLLCEALRGKDIPHKDYPDVRHAFVAFNELRSDEYSVLLAESDRMANSLLTLSEQIQKKLFSRRLEKSQTLGPNIHLK